MIENKHQHDVTLVVPNGDEELRINFYGATPTMMPLIYALDAAQDMLAAFRRIADLSDREMADGDTARTIAAEMIARATGGDAA